MVPPETAESRQTTVTQEVSASESDESEEYVEEGTAIHARVDAGLARQISDMQK